MTSSYGGVSDHGRHSTLRDFTGIAKIPSRCTEVSISNGKNMSVTAITRSVVILLAFLPIAAWAQSFDQAEDAYDRGDYETAREILSVLAKEGDAEAQYGLGLLYDNGEGVTEDHSEAARWYEAAAKQGNIAAQISLGGLYKDGEGVLQSYSQSLRWYRAAAEQGNVQAQFILGGMHAWEGTRDAISAHMWFNIAAANGHESAEQGRDLVSDQMSSSEIGEAQSRARKCLDSDYQDCD